MMGGGDKEDVGGVVLPLSSTEVDRSFTGGRAVIYFIFLIWTFLGVGIVADRFMMAIEVITSAEKEIETKRGQKIKVRVWNATIANLSLMALGSSAPEILLAVIEIISNDFHSGSLGPSTIVGSAAFNLLVIIAICVTAIPNGETRKIAELGVYKTTAFFSVFAYIWLIIILVLITPDKVDIWEALVTFLMFPLLLGLAYAADRGMFSKSSSKVQPDQHIISINGREFMAFECAEYLKNLNANSSELEASELLAQQMLSKVKPSRAQHRINAIRAMTGSKKVGRPDTKKANARSIKVLSDEEAPLKKEIAMVESAHVVEELYFVSTEYAVIENEGKVTVEVMRSSDDGQVSVSFFTRDGTATSGKDFKDTRGVITFAEGQLTQTISVKIIDDEEVEEDENFYIHLDPENIIATRTNPYKVRKDGDVTCVKIIDDDEPGNIGFQNAEVTFSETGRFAELTLVRESGCIGEIACTVSTAPGDAIEGTDYEPIPEDQTKVIFCHQQLQAHVRIPLLNTQSFTKQCCFTANLTDIVGIRAEFIKDKTTCKIMICADDKMKNIIDNVTRIVAEDMDQFQVGHETWPEQFKNAVVMEDEDDGSILGTFLHFLSLPWKVLFAFIPPTSYCGGWLCFCISLFFIGVVSALIGDLAGIFGCLLPLNPAVTAITFVALGTSLPDTFASKAAALADDTADSSVGNVTGSNSVNVFLGLGLPWTIAAIYWELEGATDDWVERYGDLYNYPKGFIVPSAGLWQSVLVFTACALQCLGVLYYRRITYGAELGGPPGPAKWAAAYFIFLWFVYVFLSALGSYEVI